MTVSMPFGPSRHHPLVDFMCPQTFVASMIGSGFTCNEVHLVESADVFQDEKEIGIDCFQVSPACREETHQKWLMPQCMAMVGELTSQSEECYDEIFNAGVCCNSFCAFCYFFY